MLLKYTNSGTQFNNKTNHQKIKYFHWERIKILCFFSFTIYSAFRWPLGSEGQIYSKRNEIITFVVFASKKYLSFW